MNARSTDSIDRIAASIATTEAERARIQPLPQTTGALSPLQVVDALASIIAAEPNAAHVTVTSGFAEALYYLLMAYPLDALAALRAERTLELQRAA